MRLGIDFQPGSFGWPHAPIFKSNNCRIRLHLDLHLDPRSLQCCLIGSGGLLSKPTRVVFHTVLHSSVHNLALIPSQALSLSSRLTSVPYLKIWRIAIIKQKSSSYWIVVTNHFFSMIFGFQCLEMLYLFIRKQSMIAMIGTIILSTILSQILSKIWVIYFDIFISL